MLPATMTLTIPDAPRLTSYTPVAPTAAFAVGFAIADPGDLEVWFDGEIVDPEDYIVQPGSLSADGFYTAAAVIFDVGIAGQLHIVGARAPRRLTQYQEGRGVPATEANKDQNLVMATLRELYDRSRRTLTVPPGSTLLELPAGQAKRIVKWNDAGTGLENGPPWDELIGETGATPDFSIGTVLTVDPGEPAAVVLSGTPENPILSFEIPQGAAGAPGPGSGDVNGPATNADNAVPRFNGANSKTLQSSGLVVDDSNNLSGVANRTGNDTNFVSGTKGTNGRLGKWDADGDMIDAGVDATDVLTKSGNLAGLTNLAAARSALGLGALAVQGSVDNNDWEGDPLDVDSGGTGATTPGNARSNLNAAAKTQTLEALPFFAKVIANETIEVIWPDMPHAGTLTRLYRILKLGSCTIRLRKNGANFGSAFSVTTAGNMDEALTMSWVQGDDIGMTISSIAGGAAYLAIMGRYTRTLE